jgi:hypothetical protein
MRSSSRQQLRLSHKSSRLLSHSARIHNQKQTQFLRRRGIELSLQVNLHIVYVFISQSGARKSSAKGNNRRVFPPEEF